MLPPYVIIDVSIWQDPAKVPYEELKAHGVVLVFIKASMGGGYDANCDKHVAEARAAGLLIGLYHWCDPTQSWERQALYFVDKIKQHNPDYICYDVEQWWNDWTKYKNHTVSFPADGCTVDQVTGNFRTIYLKVYKETGFPYERSFQYSANWFVNLYGSKLITALQEFPGRNWWADYTQLDLANWKITWSSWASLWENYFPGRTPIKPASLSWDIWQVQSRIIVPPVHNISMGLDTSCCSPALTEELRLLISGEVPAPNPDPEPEPPLPDEAIKKVVVTAGALNIRKGPNAANPLAGNALENGTEVYIYELVGSWGRIEPDQCIWIHTGYTQDV